MASLSVAIVCEVAERQGASIPEGVASVMAEYLKPLWPEYLVYLRNSTTGSPQMIPIVRHWEPFAIDEQDGVWLYFGLNCDKSLQDVPLHDRIVVVQHPEGEEDRLVYDGYSVVESMVLKQILQKGAQHAMEEFHDKYLEEEARHLLRMDWPERVMFLFGDVPIQNFQ